MGTALVLNATYEPLGVVSARRAVVLVLGEKADLLHASGHEVHSERLTVPVPSVIRLRYVVKVPFVRRAALNRRAVFARDGSRCQYCTAPAESIDHVVPRSRGGLHAWENVVAACRPCNARKENRAPADVGMRLRHAPTPPHESVWIVVAVDNVDPQWEPYLARPKRRRKAPVPA
jgi:5-methylcytosine-specific restriction endonuclease McrA